MRIQVRGCEGIRNPRRGRPWESSCLGLLYGLTHSRIACSAGTEQAGKRREEVGSSGRASSNELHRRLSQASKGAMTGAKTREGPEIGGSY